MAHEQVNYIMVEFENDDLSSPIIRDIFYSVLDEKSNQDSKEDVVIRAKNLKLEATDKISIQCGNTKIDLNSTSRGLELKGENVTSTANNRNRIRGGHISLN